MAGVIAPSVPTTQETAAVKALITYLNHGEEPKEMPPFLRVSADLVLVQGSKKDSYYSVTSKSCSCPSAAYRGGRCKHQKKFFAGEEDDNHKSQATIYQERQRELRARAKAGLNGPVDSIKPLGSFKPCLE